VGFDEPGNRALPSIAETLGFLPLSCLSSADLCAGFGELAARPFPSTVAEDDLRLALDSLRRISSALFSTFPGRAEDDLLCVSLAGLELIIVFERGSITGIRVRGLEPKEALLDTVAGPGL